MPRRDAAPPAWRTCGLPTYTRPRLANEDAEVTRLIVTDPHPDVDTSACEPDTQDDHGRPPVRDRRRRLHDDCRCRCGRTGTRVRSSGHLHAQASADVSGPDPVGPTRCA